MRRFLLAILLIVISFLAGLLLVDLIVMPLWVDKGDDVEVPSVIGMEVDRARLMLEERGLRFNTIGESFNEELPPGFIISQSPSEGLVVKRGRVVEALVSLGQEMVTVPDVTGFRVQQAKILLERAGLVPMEEREEVSELVQRDTVIRTDPPTNARVPRETELTLFVSLGRTTMDMPILEGRTLAEAQRIVEAMELKIARVDSIHSRDIRPGVVLGQKPPPGSRVVRGQDVELTVSVKGGKEERGHLREQRRQLREGQPE